MRLYRAELYKLYHKKVFLICSVLTVFTMLFYFWLMVNDQMTTVNGVTYHGYDAVRMERQITEAYRGGVTDEKVKKIVEEYGLLSEVQDVYGGKEIPLAYTEGWQIFFNTLEIGTLLADMLVIFTVSIVFSQEGQTRMQPLIFTTEEGKTTDVWAKIAAAFTLTGIVYSVVVLSDLVLCKCVFGLDGGDCPVTVALWGQVTFRPQSAAGYMPVGSFAWIIIGIKLLGMILLCAMTLCVSAYCRSTFGAVITAVSLWGLPILIRMMFGGIGYFLTSCMPIFLAFNNSVFETITFGRTIPTVLLGVCLTIACVEEGYRVYKGQF